MRVRPKVPLAIPLTLMIFLIVEVVLALAQAWVLMALVGVVSVALLIWLSTRWGRSIAPEVQRATTDSGYRPYFEPEWPRWFRLADPKFAGMAMAVVAIGLVVFVLIVLVAAKA
jgi:hypothetical protein